MVYKKKIMANPINNEDAKKMKDEQLQVEMTLNSINNMFARLKGIADPGTRHCLFVDKLCMSLDILMGLLQVRLKEYTPDIRNKAETTLSNLQKQLQDLFEWLQNPVYSPDHAFGNMLMKSAEEDMKEVSKKR